jgi:hypothetical protein
MADSPRRPAQQIVGLVGVGLDHSDGQKRITRNEDILLVGGSRETHECMQEISIKVNESLRERSKRLREAAVEEVIELLQRATEQ